MELYRRNASDGAHRLAFIDDEEGIRFTFSKYFRERGWDVMATDHTDETETYDVPEGART
jgi:hypothetical protein